MSVPSDQLPAVLNEKDEWVRKHLGHQRQLDRIARRVDDAQGQVREVRGDAELRRRLREKLDALKQKALDFGRIASSEYLDPVRDGIERVNHHLGRGNLPQAEHVIGLTEDLIRRGEARQKRRLALQRQLEVLTGRVDEARQALEASAWQPLAEALKSLRKLARDTTLEQAESAVTALTKALDEQAERIRQHQESLKGQQQERQRLAEELALWKDRGQRVDGVDGSLAVPLQALQREIDALALLAGSSALEALRSANGQVESRRDSWERPILQAEAVVEHRARQARVKALELRRAQCMLDHKAELEAAHPYYAQQLVDLDEQATELTTDLESADAEAAEAAVNELASHFGYVKDQMDAIEARQQLIKPMLEKVRTALGDVKLQIGPWKDMSRDYGLLSEEAKNPGHASWAHALEWIEDDDAASALDDFTRTYYRWDANSGDLKKQAAHAQASVRRKKLLADYERIRKQASKALQKEGTTLVGAWNLLLDGLPPPPRLEPANEKLAEEKAKALEELLKRIEDERAKSRDKALKLDEDDDGHSVARHGASVSDDALKKRLSTGTAPDGKFSPTFRSSRFFSFEVWTETRNAAILEAQDQESMDFGKDLDKPPGQGEPRVIVVEMGHGEPIGEGFQGDGPPTFKAKGNGGGDVYQSFVKLDNLQRTKTTVEWSASKGRWLVAQHFPIP